MPNPTFEDRVDWLLKFLRTDLAALRPGERIDLETDVVRFLRDPASLVPGPPPDPYRLAPERDPLQITEDALLGRLQAVLKEGVERLSTPGLRWVVPFDKIPRWVFEVEDDGTIARRYEGGLATVLLASAADLLVAAWPSLRRCAYEECQVLFKPSHGLQHYHSPNCSGLARWERFAPKRDHKQELIRRNELETERTTPGKGKK